MMGKSLFIHREILRTSVAVPIFQTPGLLKPSSSPILPALIGKGMKKINSLPEFTELLFHRKKNWTNTWPCLKKQGKEITENSEKNLAFLQWMMMLVPVWLYGCPMGRSLLKSWKDWQKKRNKLPDIKGW